MSGSRDRLGLLLPAFLVAGSAHAQGAEATAEAGPPDLAEGASDEPGASEVSADGTPDEPGASEVPADGAGSDEPEANEVESRPRTTTGDSHGDRRPEAIAP